MTELMVYGRAGGTAGVKLACKRHEGLLDYVTDMFTGFFGLVGFFLCITCGPVNWIPCIDVVSI